MSTVATWPNQAETWLDERGKGAWIAAMVLGFIFFWPVGLALLFYMIWSKRMGCSKSYRRHWRHHHQHRSYHGSGNVAFDAYKEETLKRLEDEQDAFRGFLDRLRAAKDKTEFDTFMDERADAAKNTGGEPAEA